MIKFYISQFPKPLNLLGFETRQSCEGHNDRGCAHPWVDFVMDSEEGYDLIALALIEIEPKIHALKNTPKLSYKERKELTALYKERKTLRQKFRKVLRLQKKRAQATTAALSNLLKIFYKNRTVANHREICFPLLPFPRMQSRGKKHPPLSAEKKEVALYEYQEEMDALTDFLIQQWLFEDS